MLPIADEQKDHEQEFVRTMLDASIHAILLAEPVYENGVITDFLVKAANTALITHAGIQPESATGVLITHLFPNCKKHGFFDVYIKTIHTGVQQRRELYYEDDRLEGWFDIAVSRHRSLLVINFQNITDTKNFQKEMEQSANHLHAIINTAQSGIFLFAPVKNETGEIIDFKFTDVNPAIASYVGQPPHHLIGELGSKWFPSYKEIGLFDKYKHTYETATSIRFVFHYDADGLDVWLDIMATKLDDEVLVTFTDFTSVKKLQLELEDTIKELTRSNASLRDFAYIASHDLQEPLRKIHFFADRLKQRFKPVLTGDGEMIIDRIEAASSRMGKLINDLLEYSQASSTDSDPVVVHVRDLINEVLFDLETTIQQKKATIIVGNMPVVKADPVMLRQMFQNLVGNALKYQQQDTAPKIVIRSSNVMGLEMGKRTKSADHHKQFHLIEVEDNGVGFEQEHAERIFQIFQRLHGRSQYPGTGVGLAIVQKVVENHNGYIWADSAPGKGATFSVLLPAIE